MNNQDQGETKINEDIFGVTYNKETGERVNPPAPEAKKEEDKDKGDDKETPLEKELRLQIKKLEDDKKSLGGNLSKQGKIIDELKKEVDAIKKGTKSDDKPDLPYKEIKRSKDLSQDERDEMTQSELKMMDQLAEMQEKANQDYLKSIENKGDKGGDKGDDDDDEEDEGDGEDKKIPADFEKNVMKLAMEMTGGDSDMANKIIGEFNQFAENYKLDEAGLKERLEKASKLIPGFVMKPTKTINGSSAGKDTGKSFLDEIVDSASTKAKGGGKSFSL